MLSQQGSSFIPTRQQNGASLTHLGYEGSELALGSQPAPNASCEEQGLGDPKSSPLAQGLGWGLGLLQLPEGRAKPLGSFGSISIPLPHALLSF